VKLREGVSLLGRLVGIPLDKVSVGLLVRFRRSSSGTRTASGFGPPDTTASLRHDFEDGLARSA